MIAAYSSGSQTEETRAQLQKLQVELGEVNSDIEENAYDQYISDQKEILSTIMEQYSEVLDAKAEDTEALFAQAMLEAETNVDTIVGAINKVAEAVGYNPQTGVTELITGESKSITENVVQLDPETVLDLKNTETNTKDTATGVKEAGENAKVFNKDLIETANANATTLNKGHSDLNRQMIMLTGETDERIVTSNGITLKKLGNVQTNMDASFANTNNAIASVSSAMRDLANQYLRYAAYESRSIGTTTVGDVNVKIETQATDAQELMRTLQNSGKFKNIVVDAVSASLR